MITPLQYSMMRDKTERARKAPAQAVRDEIAELHQPILAWLKANSVAYKYSRPDKKSRDTKGSPDFCFCWKGKTLWVECKSESGEMRPEQNAWIRQASDQGVFPQIVCNMQQFYELVRT